MNHSKLQFGVGTTITLPNPIPVVQSHYEKYKDVNLQIGRDGSEDICLGYDKAWWAERLRNDINLNSVALAFFDSYFPTFERSVKIVNDNNSDQPRLWSSLADNCCSLKHMVIYQFLSLSPEFIDHVKIYNSSKEWTKLAKAWENI